MNIVIVLSGIILSYCITANAFIFKTWGRQNSGTESALKYFDIPASGGSAILRLTFPVVNFNFLFRLLENTINRCH